MMNSWTTCKTFYHRYHHAPIISLLLEKVMLRNFESGPQWSAEPNPTPSKAMHKVPLLCIGYCIQLSKACEHFIIVLSFQECNTMLCQPEIAPSSIDRLIIFYRPSWHWQNICWLKDRKDTSEQLVWVQPYLSHSTYYRWGSSMFNCDDDCISITFSKFPWVDSGSIVVWLRSILTSFHSWRFTHEGYGVSVSFCESLDPLTLGKLLIKHN